MKLQASTTNAPVSDSTPPAGTYAATCIGVFDLGTQEQNWNGKVNYRRQILLMFRMIADGKEYLVSKRYTASLHEKSKFRSDLVAWRGKDFTHLEAMEFDTESLLRKPCMLTIVHYATANDTIRAKIGGITKIPKGLVAPPVDKVWSYEIYRDGTNFPQDAPRWIYELVLNSQESKSGKVKIQRPGQQRVPILAEEQDKLPKDAMNAPIEMPKEQDSGDDIPF